jgi:hypothetical protein
MRKKARVARECAAHRRQVIVGAKLLEHLHDYTGYQVQLDVLVSCPRARPYPAAVADLRG